MTESMSGFFAPEEQAVLEHQKLARGADAPSPDVSVAILQTLAIHGAMTIGDLLPKVSARPRVIVSSLDELEKAGRVRVRTQDAEEVVELTDEGRAVMGA